MEQVIPGEKEIFLYPKKFKSWKEKPNKNFCIATIIPGIVKYENPVYFVIVEEVRNCSIYETVDSFYSYVYSHFFYNGVLGNSRLVMFFKDRAENRYVMVKFGSKQVLKDGSLLFKEPTFIPVDKDRKTLLKNLISYVEQ
ncbi:hypothetical protein [Desulfurobacterium sp.]|uniref:hypothetical protein n=1 Tax=Desulfurobacterium sp. TaxID=2004706 RepID=UPI002607A5AC|nr:hypothetical protein [Desulfurobacterium sp.]